MLHEDELFTIELFGLSRRSVFIDPRIWFLRRIRDGSIMNIPKSSSNFNGYETCFSDFASTAKSLRGINGSEVTLELLMLSMQRVLLVQIDTFSRMQGILLLRYRLKIFNNVYAYIKLFSFDLKIALLCILPDIKILYRLFLRLKKSNSVEK